MNIDQIAVVVYDNLSADCDSIRQNLIDLTWWKVNYGAIDHNFYIQITSDIDQTLQKLPDKFSWVLVIEAGHFLADQHFIKQNVDYAIEQNSPLSCHIIDTGNFYYFDPQWFVLNLQVYREVGLPELQTKKSSLEFDCKTVVRCDQNIHDDYTPLWITGTNDTIQTYKVPIQNFGMHLIKNLLDKNYTIVNIPINIRKNKSHSYPNHNYQHLENLMKDPFYTLEKVEQKYHEAFFEFSQWIKLGYSHFGIYLINTEPLIDTNLNFQQLDCFIGPAAGIKPILLLGRECFADDTKVYLIDNSLSSLIWQQFLLKNWDGTASKLHGLAEKFSNLHRAGKKIFLMDNLNQEWVDRMLKCLLETAKVNEEDLVKSWNKYKKMQHHLIHRRISQNDDFTTLIDNSAGCYLWMSNIFHGDYDIFSQTSKVCQHNIDKFIEELKNKITKPCVVEAHGRAIDLINF
jgi:hypothetical protein